MSEHIVLTGISGAIGQPLAARLLARPTLKCLTAIVRPATDVTTLPATLSGLHPEADLSKLRLVTGDLEQPQLGLADEIFGPAVTTIVHSAAITKFKVPADQWARVNVAGTRALIHWRETHCADARFIHLSTLCAAGKSVGFIPEEPLDRPPGFVNGYEDSKWQAEEIVREATGDRLILRLATVVGNRSDGALRRVGAFHHVLRWVYRGLLPLIPGNDQTRIDLIPTELVTEGICRLLDQPSDAPLSFHHFSRGAEAIPLQELIDLCAADFEGESLAWKRGQISAPVLASRTAFEEFRQSVVASRDLLFTQVMDSVDSFLPELFFPKQFETNSQTALFAGNPPLDDWKSWMQRVLAFSLRSDFGRAP